MNKIKIEEEHIRKFISYCQTHPIDDYIINKYGNDILYNFELIDSLSMSHEYPYYLVEYKGDAYIFRIKDKNILIRLNKHEFEPEKIKPDNCLFDYDSNEMENIVNGHHIISILYSYGDGSHAYIAFDKATKKAVLHINNDKVSIHPNIDNIINIPSDLCDDDWTTIDDIPKELEEIVTVQKLMLTMYGGE